MDSHFYAASAYAQLFLRGARQPAAQLLASSGLTEASLLERDYVSATEMGIVMRNIEASDPDSGWAARVGSQLNISTHGPLGFAALSAPSLGAALQVMEEFYAVRINTLSAELQQAGNRYRFAMTDLSGDELYGYWILESTLRVLESLIETIVGHPVGDNVVISFTRPAPAYADELERVYGAPCEFGASHNAISMPASWQHIPSPLYDESTYRANIAKCREIIAAQADDRDPVQQVRNILAIHFDRTRSGDLTTQAPPGLGEIAAQLHTTPRTLIRRLKRHGYAYKMLLDQARVEAAEDLLQQASLTVADVGERLGYRDPANFGRAFRKWKGVTPAAWRRGQG
ncbi:MAG: AraC family transcriptional regulator ligand-binding domain-containing protein [Marinobacter sp.]|uniref:AraC family transcriptional regulator n=1 Tax=Marinobacter sp. TaxID=50741 RepID=UPI003299F08A